MGAGLPAGGDGAGAGVEAAGGLGVGAGGALWLGGDGVGVGAGVLCPIGAVATANAGEASRKVASVMAVRVILGHLLCCNIRSSQPNDDHRVTSRLLLA